MQRAGEIQDKAAPQKHSATAVRLDGGPLPEDTPNSWFVGVGCRRCGSIYALEVPTSQDIHELLAAVEWVEGKMGFCGAHPDLLIEK